MITTDLTWIKLNFVYSLISLGISLSHLYFIPELMNKMFVLMPLKRGNTISLKCDPEYALELRERYPEEIQAAWHMNKTHWNSVILNGTVGRKLIEELITHSYDLVVAKLKKADKAALQAMKEQEEE